MGVSADEVEGAQQPGDGEALGCDGGEMHRRDRGAGLGWGTEALFQAVIMIPRDGVIMIPGDDGRRDERGADARAGPTLPVPGRDGTDYGYIDGTLGSNDGPLDVVVLTARQTVIGEPVPIRVLGLLERGPELLVLSVAADEPAWRHLREVEEVEATWLAAIAATSFNPYLEARLGAPVPKWHGRRQAEDLVQRALRDFECAEDRLDLDEELE